MAYIYQAELWCNSCGEGIRSELTNAGKRPADGTLADSDEWPAHIGTPDASDSVHHCASGEACYNALDLTEYREPGDPWTLYGAETWGIGELLTEELTEHGARELRETLSAEYGSLTPYQGALHAFWGQAFADELAVF